MRRGWAGEEQRIQPASIATLRIATLRDMPSQEVEVYRKQSLILPKNKVALIFAFVSLALEVALGPGVLKH